jgi:hypothetical protein
MGQHRLLPGKFMGYEEDIGAHLLVRGPGVPAGETLPHLVGAVDLAPTMAEMAGIPIADYMDGRSLMPLLSASPPTLDSWRQAILFEQYVTDADREHDPLGEPPDPFDSPRFGDIPLFYDGLRTASKKYIEYNDGERELYQLVGDPDELENQYANADPTELAILSAWLRELHTCAADVCRSVEMQPPDPPAAPACIDLDFDGNLSITIADIGLLLAHWGETPLSPGWDARFDLNHDNVVDSADVVLIAWRWQEICEPV